MTNWSEEDRKFEVREPAENGPVTGIPDLGPTHGWKETSGPACVVCGHRSEGIGDHDDVVARCTQHDEGPFCGVCFDAHSEETGCGVEA